METTEALSPLLLKPRLVPKPWGGTRLGAWGKPVLADAAVGESWELFDDAAGSVQVAEGPLAGRELRSLARDWGAELLGADLAAEGGSFPLLIKLLDAGQDLSVQVHPDDALARELHGPQARGKSEMWVVLEAASGACVYSGFKDGVDAAAFESALAAGRVLELLRKVPVAPGDVIDIPAGRVHAIGAGCLLAEVQQNSDWTYRVWDHGRLEGGRPRQLHLDPARRALRFDALGLSDGRQEPRPQAEDWGAREALVQNAFFGVQRWRLQAPLALPAPGRPRLLLPLQGQLRLVWGQEAGMMVPAGATVLLPAALACRIEPAHGAVTLLSIEPGVSPA
jgi:mannose-6-phosphate isomerase